MDTKQDNAESCVANDAYEIGMAMERTFIRDDSLRKMQRRVSDEAMRLGDRACAKMLEAVVAFRSDKPSETIDAVVIASGLAGNCSDRARQCITDFSGLTSRVEAAAGLTRSLGIVAANEKSFSKKARKILADAVESRVEDARRGVRATRPGIFGRS